MAGGGGVEGDRRGGSILRSMGRNSVGKVFFLLAGPDFYHLEFHVAFREGNGSQGMGWREESQRHFVSLDTGVLQGREEQKQSARWEL